MAAPPVHVVNRNFYMRKVEYAEKGTETQVVRERMAILTKLYEKKVFADEDTNVKDAVSAMDKVRKCARKDKMREDNHAVTGETFITASTEQWSFVLNYLDGDGRLQYVKRIAKDLFEKRDGKKIGNCDDEDVKVLINQYVSKRRNRGIIQKTYKSYVSKMRCMFRIFGRLHSWGDSEKFHQGAVETFMSGNPVTDGVKKSFLDKVEKDERNAKYSMPVSVPVAYYSMMQHFWEALRKFKLSNERGKTRDQHIENLCTLALLKSLIIHEGCRPSENFKNLRHNDCRLLLHEEIPWLVLVFIKPETLAHILQGDHIKHYIIEFWKAGKGRGAKGATQRPRIKSAVPCAYNTLDVMWMYVVSLKLMYMVDATLLNHKVFPKKCSNLFDIHASNQKDEDVKFTFYGIRYAAAEEDKALHINKKRTRYRMGHTDESDLYAMYGNNDKHRITDDCDFEFKLGTDDKDDDKSNIHNDLEMNCIPNALHNKSTWLKDTFGGNDDMITDFTRTTELVKGFLKDPTSAAAAAMLMDRLDRLDTSFESIPCGTHIQFADGMMSEALETKHTKTIAMMKQHMKPASKDKGKLMLRYYAQTIYNHWGNPYSRDTDYRKKVNEALAVVTKEDGEDEERELKIIEKTGGFDNDDDVERVVEPQTPKTPKKKKTAIATATASEVVEPVQPPKKKKKMTHVEKTLEEPAPAPVDEVNPPPLKEIDMEDGGDDDDMMNVHTFTFTFNVDDLKVGDVVVLMTQWTTTQQKFLMLIDKNLPPLWIVLVEKVERSGVIKGRWYFYKKDKKTKLIDDAGLLDAGHLLLAKEVEQVENIGVNLMHVFPAGTFLEFTAEVMESIKEKLRINSLSGHCL
jgi:hypothetical protein